uniref:Desmoplakin SH3 domain-containing protein n=1 Tax=Biomphalaria glabrata TaxID=6526 RepID=A0A2C9L456_BIOGL
MLSFLLWMDSSTVRAQVKTQDPDVMFKHFRLIIKQLLDYQGQLDLLTDRSRDIHPVHYRKELPEWPLKARALVQYQHKHVSLAKGDFVMILENSDAERWKIKTLDGIESEVPAIVLVIPPADPSCFQQIDKLREQIKVNSFIAAKRLRSHLIQFLSSAISQTQSKDTLF